MREDESNLLTSGIFSASEEYKKIQSDLKTGSVVLYVFSTTHSYTAALTKGFSFDKVYVLCCLALRESQRANMISD